MKRIFFTILFAGFVFTSCEHKELCFDHGHVRVPVSVVFDWRNAPEAAPKSMSLFLYPKAGGEPLRYEFAGRDGGTISIPIGDYDALCVNSDSEAALFRNMDRMETFEIRTDETELLSSLNLRSDEVPRAEGAETERVIATPEPMWGGRTNNVTLVLLELRAASDEELQTIVLYPEEIVCHYSVEIRNVSNLKHVSAVSGSLSGMSEGVLLASNTPTPTRATMPFAAATEGEGIITASWLTFGHCPDAGGSAAGAGGSGAAAAAKHNLIIYVLYRTGEKYYYTFDVTEKIHAAADPRHIHIVLDEGVPLPDPGVIEGGGGFAPSVNDWEPVYIDISM